MLISELLSFTPSTHEAIDSLMHLLSENSSCSAEQLQQVVASPDSHLYVLEEANTGIVGTATLCVGHTPEQTLGFIESVVVHPCTRGKGYGRALMQHLLTEAQRLGVTELHLTSRPSREAANALYQALGFQRKETNVYYYKVRG